MEPCSTAGGERKGEFTIGDARLGGGGGEDAEALAAARADRAAAEVGAVGLRREGRGQGLGFRERGSCRRDEGEGSPEAIGGRIRAWRRRPLRLPWRCSTNCASQVEGAPPAPENVLFTT